MIHESQIPRSCDLCYTNKEKCQWVTSTTQCERCYRIGRPCETKRPVKRLGRPARSRQMANHESASLEPSLQICSTKKDDKFLCLTITEKESFDSAAVLDASLWRAVLASSQELSNHELICLYRAIHRDDLLQQFVLGPSFCEAHKQKLIFHLLSSSSIVLDAYLACALSFAAENAADSSLSTKRSANDARYKHAAAALVKLRSLTVADGVQTTSCLILGWQILHFVLKVGGHELLEICAQTLNLIKPNLGSHGTFDRGYSSFLTSTVLTETAEGLLKTRSPTLRLDAAAMTPQVDGCVGIGGTLLPYLYDLAVINVEMCENAKLGVNDFADNQGAQLLERLDSVHRQIRLWQPQIPDDFCSQYTSTEVLHMTCQAQVMKIAALLVVHRLRHPFGEEDAAASALSSTILSQLDMVVVVTGRIPYAVDFPLIVSCLEVDDDEERAMRLKNFSSIGSYSCKFHRRVEVLGDAFWVARRSTPRLPWYALGDILATFF